MKLFLIAALLVRPAAAEVTDLISAYQLALKKDPAFQAARASRDAEAAEVPKAVSGFLPSLGFSGTASRNDTQNTATTGAGSITTRNYYLSESYALNARQPLFRWQNIEQFRQARAISRRADATFRQERQTLAIRVAESYFGVLLAEAMLRVETSRRETFERTLEQAEKAQQAGAGTLTDVYETRARRDLAIASALEAENAVETSRTVLAALLGEEPGALAPVEPKSLPLAEARAPAETWLSKAQDFNPTLAALREEVTVSDRETGKAFAGHLPSLDLFAAHRRASNELEIAPNRDTKSNLIGLQFSVPIFSGGYAYAATSQAQARAERSRHRFEAGKRELELSVRKEFGRVRQYGLKVSALEQAVDSVEKALQGTQKGVQAGTRTNVDVLNAQDLVFRTQFELAKAAHDFALSYLKLNDASGTLDEQLLGDVNGWLRR